MRSAWDAFQTGIQPEVPEELLMSWRRSQWSGVDPLRTEIAVVDFDAESPLVRTASPILKRVTDLLGGNACLALADARGRILWRWVSDLQMDRDLADCRMLEGGAFSEESVGTNGIGTALESRKAAVVVGAAHFVEAFHAWACVAAPILHPVTHRVHGAVNITCYSGEANQFLKAMVHELANAISQALLADATAAERRLFDAYIQARQKTTAPVVALSAQTMIVDDAAGNWNLNHYETWQRLSSAPNHSALELSANLHATVHRIDDGKAAILALYPASTLQLGHIGRETRPGQLTTGPLENAEAAVIAETLNACGGNKSATAARLGISRATLYQRLRRYRIDALREPTGTPPQSDRS